MIPKKDGENSQGPGFKKGLLETLQGSDVAANSLKSRAGEVFVRLQCTLVSHTILEGSCLFATFLPTRRQRE